MLCYIFWSEIFLETDVYKYNSTSFSCPVSPLSHIEMGSWGRKKSLTCILEILLNMCSLYKGRLNNWESPDLKNALSPLEMLEEKLWVTETEYHVYHV